jgi:hypothetical protein
VPSPPYDAVVPVLRALTGREPVAAREVREGAYSNAARWVVTFAGGPAAFVKAEVADDGPYGTHTEHLVYAAVALPCLPALYGYEPGGEDVPRVLVTEDLSGARWGAPVTAADAGLLGDAFDALAGVPAPAGLAPVTFEPGWARFARDPAPLLATGLVDAGWLDRHLPALAAAEATVDTAGDRLVHLDLWLQNWCRAARGAVLVDWAGAAAADPLLMRAWAEAGVRAAGGPPGLVLRGEPGWAAWAAGIAGSFLSENAGTYVRLLETERREALATLRWACAELGLPEPAVSPPFAALPTWRP